MSTPVWWNGRHKGLKIPRHNNRAGSTPATGTKTKNPVGFCRQDFSFCIIHFSLFNIHHSLKQDFSMNNK